MSQPKSGGLPRLTPLTVILYLVIGGPLLYFLVQLLPVGITGDTAFLVTFIGLGIGLFFWGFYQRTSLKVDKAE